MAKIAGYTADVILVDDSEEDFVLIASSHREPIKRHKASTEAFQEPYKEMKAEQKKARKRYNHINAIKRGR